MTPTERVNAMLAEIRPVLDAQGKHIAILEANDEQISLALLGFCGGCGCADDYSNGLREMLTKEFPRAKIDLAIS